MLFVPWFASQYEVKCGRPWKVASIFSYQYSVPFFHYNNIAPNSYLKKKMGYPNVELAITTTKGSFPGCLGLASLADDRNRWV